MLDKKVFRPPTTNLRLLNKTDNGGKEGRRQGREGKGREKEGK
jgi:hypothetical protein